MLDTLELGEQLLGRAFHFSVASALDVVQRREFGKLALHAGTERGRNGLVRARDLVVFASRKQSAPQSGIAFGLESVPSLAKLRFERLALGLVLLPGGVDFPRPRGRRGLLPSLVDAVSVDGICASAEPSGGGTS